MSLFFVILKTVMQYMEKFSEYLVCNLFSKQITSDDQKEVYVYGMTLFLTTLLGIISILLLSVFLFDFSDGVLFLVVFALLRIHAGGYHCNTYAACFFVSNIIFLVTVSAAKGISLLQEPIALTVAVVLLVASWGYIVCNAPVVAKGHQISKRKTAKNRRRSIVLSTLISCVAILLILVFGNDYGIRYSCCIVATTVASVAVLMQISKFIERRKQNA